MGKLNPWLAEKLAVDPPRMSFIVEPEPGQAAAVRRQIAQIPGVSVEGTAAGYLRVIGPDRAAVPLGNIPEVSMVHYDAPFTAVSHTVWHDPLLGAIELSNVLVPTARKRAANLFQLLAGPKATSFAPDEVVTTAAVREWLGFADNPPISDVRVAVIDTGVTQPHPMFPPWRGPILSINTFPGAPFDVMGHGMWTTSALAGSPYRGKLGYCEGIALVSAPSLLHVKALGDDGGGSTFSILRALEVAYAWGAKVVSMSLAGPLQGSVFFDPVCQAITRFRDRMSVIVAAGNEGPGSYTIGSPGASPDALTVGAGSIWSGRVSQFSSRGPQADWYSARQAEYAEDRGLVIERGGQGDDMLKPDVLAPGGDLGEGSELVYSGVTGWLDGENDGRLDAFEPLRGSSMSAPIFAGAFVRAISAGLFENVAQLKRGLAASGRAKSYESGYGPVRWSEMVRARDAVVGGLEGTFSAGGVR